MSLHLSSPAKALFFFFSSRIRTAVCLKATVEPGNQREGRRLTRRLREWHERATIASLSHSQHPAVTHTQDSCPLPPTPHPYPHPSTYTSISVSISRGARQGKGKKVSVSGKSDSPALVERLHRAVDGAVCKVLMQPGWEASSCHHCRRKSSQLRRERRRP